ncbi:MAG: hypothetical protein ACOY4K_15575 [Pseudomonadota bacterium]
MRVLTAAAIIAAVAASAAPALAADRLSDADFVRAARCQGLAPESAGEAIGKLVRSQKRGRSDHVLERAANARYEGERLARVDADAAQAAFAADCAGLGG